MAAQTRTSPAPVLHEDPRSGNCYKIRLTAGLLQQPLERRQYDILNGETRTPEFLEQVNVNGRIPVLQVRAEGGWRFLPESNAACFYLAEGSALVPQDRLDRADMLRWMFFEQNHHEPNVATLRLWLAFVGENNLSDLQRAQIPAKRAGGEEALAAMDRHLATRDWFAGTRASLADVALYAYTSVCEEGGFSLAAHPNIGRWLERVESLPDYVPWGRLANVTQSPI
jgi:glutathione S-transferase